MEQSRKTELKEEVWFSEIEEGREKRDFRDDCVWLAFKQER